MIRFIRSQCVQNGDNSFNQIYQTKDIENKELEDWLTHNGEARGEDFVGLEIIQEATDEQAD